MEARPVPLKTRRAGMGLVVSRVIGIIGGVHGQIDLVPLAPSLNPRACHSSSPGNSMPFGTVPEPMSANDLLSANGD
ncbi:hypothetical protein LZ189_03610, partial [Rhodovulum sulfidophilum]|nr:hypothetical protein [Rhodovulum sulfidophilum]